jgi:hypothetical protein
MGLSSALNTGKTPLVFSRITLSFRYAKQKQPEVGVDETNMASAFLCLTLGHVNGKKVGHTVFTKACSDKHQRPGHLCGVIAAANF